MEVKTTPLNAMRDLVSRITYKPGWRFEVQERIEYNAINVGVCLTTLEQNPAQRRDQERERELWRSQQRAGYFEQEASMSMRGYVNMFPREEPKTMVWREVPFMIPDIRDLSEELIVGRIWEMVILIEAHEIKEFFRVGGLCVQEPHPEAPRELAYDGMLDRWDFVDDLMRGTRV